MNFCNINFDTIEDGMKELKIAVDRRNRCCGSMYQEIFHDDAAEIAEKIIRLGGDEAEVNKELYRGY